MLEISDKTLISLSDSIVLQSLSDLDMYYAFNIETGDHYKLNSSAYWILKKIDEGYSFNSLKQEFVSEYGIDKETAQKDIDDIVQYSLDNKIIIIEENMQ